MKRGTPIAFLNVVLNVGRHADLVPFLRASVDGLEFPLESMNVPPFQGTGIVDYYSIIPFQNKVLEGLVRIPPTNVLIQLVFEMK